MTKEHYPLKPCPFCGEIYVDVQFNYIEKQNLGWCWVECSLCKAKAKAFKVSPVVIENESNKDFENRIIPEIKNAVYAWNRRRDAIGKGEKIPTANRAIRCSN